MKREKITKGWSVVGRDAEGKLRQLSRRYHAKAAADEFAEQAKKAGYQDVCVRTNEGYDKRP